MLFTKDLYNKQVYFKGSKKSVGRIRSFLVYDKKLIGVVVKRPDVALIFHRTPVFINYNNLFMLNENTAINGKKDFNKNPNKVFQEEQVIIENAEEWIDAEVVFNNQKIGTVKDLAIGEKTGKIEWVELSQGLINGTILGKSKINQENIKQYNIHTGKIELNKTAEIITMEEGLADKAGKTTSKMIHKIKLSIPKVKKKTEETTQTVKEKTKNLGEYTTEKSSDAKNKAVDISKKATKATKKGAEKVIDNMQETSDDLHKMFRDFKDEFNKGLNGEE